MSSYNFSSFWDKANDLTYREMLDASRRIVVALENCGIDPPSISEMADALSLAANHFEDEAKAKEAAKQAVAQAKQV